jgi:hypothetical protein
MIDKLLQKKLSVIFIYSLLILIWYRNSFFTYFQSDEWHFFNVYLPYSKTWLGIVRAAIDTILQSSRFTNPHATPLSIILWVMSMKLFGLNATYYIGSSLIIHILNSYLLYLFTLKFTKNSSIGFISGLFFALSANQYQSVIWIGTYLLTSLGTTFFLFTLIYFVDYATHNQSKWPFITATIFSLLTKESTIAVLPVCLLVLLCIKKSHKKIKVYGSWLIKSAQFKVLFMIGLIYVPIRMVIMFIFARNHEIATSLGSKDPQFTLLLVLYRIITYPIKMFGDIFVPIQIVPTIVEFLTPFAYPYYAAEKDVRGTTFLLFTQSAGIDLLIYPFAVATILLFMFLYYINRDSLYKKLLVVGSGTIIFASWPLILIATFAPAAAYVSFFDSRHMYLASVGAGLMIGFLGRYICATRLPNMRHFGVYLFFVLSAMWLVIHYQSLQNSLGQYISMGQDRRKLVGAIMEDVDKTKKSGVFYINSNSSYYGYGDLMPPFETNFGQVLTVHLNQKELLSNEFLDTSYLTKKGLNGQGLKIEGKQVFGYFIDFDKLIRSMKKNNISINDLYAYSWDGKSSVATVITDSVRSELKERIAVLSKYDEWQDLTLEEIRFSMKIPPGYSLEVIDRDSEDVVHAYELRSAESTYKLLFKKRIFNVGIYEDVSLMMNSDRELIGDNYYYRTIQMKNGNSTIAKIPNRGFQTIYFLPAILSDIIIEIHIGGVSATQDYGDEILEEIISLMRHPID